MIGKVYSPISPSRLMVNKGECPFLLLSPEQTMCGLLSPLATPEGQGVDHSFRSTLMAFALSDFIHFLRMFGLEYAWVDSLSWDLSQSPIPQIKIKLWSKLLSF